MKAPWFQSLPAPIIWVFFIGCYFSKGLGSKRCTRGTDCKTDVSLCGTCRVLNASFYLWLWYFAQWQNSRLQTQVMRGLSLRDGPGRKGWTLRQLSATCNSFLSEVWRMREHFEGDDITLSDNDRQSKKRTTLYVFLSNVQNTSCKSIRGTVWCSHGFNILLMDTTGFGVNTWMPEDNDDWLMKCVNHILASLTHSIFPFCLQRFRS